MKDRKYSDTSDAFLCEILSKKCNQFLSNCNTQKTRQLMQISQTIKLSNNQIQRTKTILSQSKLTYSSMLSRSTLRQIAFEQTQQLRRKQEQLLAELMRHIVQNIRLQMEQILLHRTCLTTDKHAFRLVLEIMEEEYCLINDQLARVRKYTRKKEIRDVINLDIDIVGPSQFVELVFSNLPNLKEFFSKFQIEVFNNQQIQQLRDQSDLIYEIVDLDSLIEKRMKQKRQKKRNKKKKNKDKKCQSSTGQSTNDGCENNQKATVEQQQVESLLEEIKIAQYLQQMKIGTQRMGCGVSEDWLTKLSLQYVQ